MAKKTPTNHAREPGMRVPTGEFYPPIEPFSLFYLPVGGKHVLYVEQSGNPNGIPVIVLHGGPGGGSSPALRQYFDPQVYRIVIFDQRGCGKSKPLAELEDNTTWHLVEDIERIRVHLGLKSWHVFGGSWGSTLALTYAICHPKRVRSLVMRGIFLGRRSEVDWFYQDGNSHVFVEAFDKLTSIIPRKERKDIVLAYHKRLTGSNEKVRNEAAIAWSQYESACLYLIPRPEAVEQAGQLNKALGLSCLENWYFMNGCFFEGNERNRKRPKKHWILRNIDKIRDIPTVFCDGRYDMDCPIRSAFDLAKAWPEAQMVLLPDSGHSAGETSMRRALITATDWFGLADRAGKLHRATLAQ